MRKPTAIWSINATYVPGTAGRVGGPKEFFSTSSTSFSQTGLLIPFGPDSGGFAIGAGFTQSKDFNQSMKYNGFNPTASLIADLAAKDDPFLRSLGLSYQTFDPATGEYLGDATIIHGNMLESGFISDQGGLVHISVGFGDEVAPGIFIGASASYATGTYLSDREYTESDTANIYGSSVQTNPDDPLTNDFQLAYIHDIRNTTYTGWDMKVGVLYSISASMGVSASFKLPFRHTVDEIKISSGYADYADGGRIEPASTQTDTRYTIMPAYEATVGAMVSFWILTGSVEATFIDYTQIDFAGGPFAGATALVQKEAEEKFRQVVNINAGAEFQLPFTGLVARGGFIYLPSPMAGDPGRFNIKTATAGFGINLADRMQIDFGYGLGFRTRSGDRYNVDGVTEDVVTHDFLVSMRFHF